MFGSCVRSQPGKKNVFALNSACQLVIPTNKLHKSSVKFVVSCESCSSLGFEVRNEMVC